MKTSVELQTALRQYFGGGDIFLYSPNHNFHYTEGVLAFAEGAEAFWLLDIVATEIVQLQHDEGFIKVVMTSKDGKALVTCGDGNNNIFYSKSIDFTDAPEGTWEFYLIDFLLLLTTEY